LASIAVSPSGLVKAAPTPFDTAALSRAVRGLLSSSQAFARE
jgi:hypothetical protein